MVGYYNNYNSRLYAKHGLLADEQLGERHLLHDETLVMTGLHKVMTQADVIC